MTGQLGTSEYEGLGGKQRRLGKHHIYTFSDSSWMETEHHENWSGAYHPDLTQPRFSEHIRYSVLLFQLMGEYPALLVIA